MRLLKCQLYSSLFLAICGACASHRPARKPCDGTRPGVCRAMRFDGKHFSTKDCAGPHATDVPEKFWGQCFEKKCNRATGVCRSKGSQELRRFFEERRAQNEAARSKRLDEVASLCEQRPLKNAKFAEWKPSSAVLRLIKVTCPESQLSRDGERVQETADKNEEQTFVRYQGGRQEYAWVTSRKSSAGVGVARRGFAEWKRFHNGNISVRGPQFAQCRWYGSDGHFVHGFLAPSLVKEAGQNLCTAGPADIIYEKAAVWPVSEKDAVIDDPATILNKVMQGSYDR